MSRPRWYERQARRRRGGQQLGLPGVSPWVEVHAPGEWDELAWIEALDRRVLARLERWRRSGCRLLRAGFGVTRLRASARVSGAVRLRGRCVRARGC